MLLTQSRQQVSGQPKSPVFDTEQIIVTLSCCLHVQESGSCISLSAWCVLGDICSASFPEIRAAPAAGREMMSGKKFSIMMDSRCLDLLFCYYKQPHRKKKNQNTNKQTKQKTSLKFSEPSRNSLEAQFFANGILFVSLLLFVTHQALIPFVLFCLVLFFHNIFLCQQANSLIHHSLQSAVNSIFIPGGTSLLLPFSIPFLTSL